LKDKSTRLEARGLNFAFLRPAVRDFSLSLAAGTITGMAGPNGSGKTTVLRLLDGILRPMSGEVVLGGGTPISGLKRKQIARHIAMVPQNGVTYHSQTVFQFAMQGRSPHLSLLGFESRRDEEITLEALQMTKLTRHMNSPMTEISGGEKQRLLLARALVQKTEVLLLDEFTANLDINYQVELLRLVKRVTKERNLATLIVSHEINLLAAFCDRIVLMADGAVFHQGSVNEVLTRRNLQHIFRLDFSVRQLSDGTVKVMPIINEGYYL